MTAEPAASGMIDRDMGGRVEGCPACGAEFTGYCYETEQPQPVEYDGGVLDEVLAGRTVVEHPPLVVTALILDQCGHRVPTDEWQLCQVLFSRWFARPEDVERTIRAALCRASVMGEPAHGCGGTRGCQPWAPDWTWPGHQWPGQRHPWADFDPLGRDRQKLRT